MSEAYAKLPLSFEANRGQSDRAVDFVARGLGYALFLTPTEAVFAFRRSSVAEASPDTAPAVLRIRLAGGNPSARPVALGELPGRVNYLRGNDPTQWLTAVATYRQVLYRDVYPGIDVTYYGRQGELEYDLVVAPGADPDAIRLVMDGARRVELDPEGSLVLRVASDTLHQRPPVAYQEIGGRRRLVPARYVLRGANEVGVRLGAYDRTRPVVIDPVLVYSTYLGGTRIDAGYAIAVDDSGNAYVTGRTQSANFPTVNSIRSYGGSDDVFVAKLNPAGTALVYATFLGGSGSDSGEGIAVDGLGHAYVTGQTRSTGFPVANAVQPQSAGSFDAFVVKLSPSGSSLVYSTYLGGQGNDVGYSIAVDSAGTAYVTGETFSSNFPKVQPLQGSYRGGGDAFVATLSPVGALLYATFLGGSGLDSGYGIAVDASGIYVTGRTRSANFPTRNPIDGTRSGTEDAFVAKLALSGSALLYSTYLGGSGADAGNGIAVDGAGNAYVTGSTRSLDFPRVNAFQPAHGGGPDAFVTKLNATGSALVFSTYLGGSTDDIGNGIAVDRAGNAYIVGTTRSNDFPILNAIQPVYHGSFEGFVTKLSPAGALLYSTYFGGGNDDYAFGIAADDCGNAYITGQTSARDFPIVPNPGALQPTFAGSQDAFVAKIGDTEICQPDVRITKVAEPDPVAPGAQLTYTLTVENLSQSPAMNVVVTDSLPAGTTFVSCSPSQGTCGEVGGVVTAQLGTLGPGGTATISVVVTAPTGPQCTTLTNAATVTATVDGVPVSDTATTTVACARIPDVAITKVDNPDPVSQGAPLTYTLTVQNVSTVTATNVVVTDPLPPGTGFVSCAASQGTCVNNAGTVTANLGTLVAGASATLTLVVTAPTTDPCGPITNIATVSATGDSNAANDTAQAVTQCTVPPPPDVAITKLHNPDPVSQGAPLTYTLTVQNVSTVSAGNVAVSDPLPPGTGFVSCTASQGTCINNAGTVTANLGTLVAGASATLTLVVTAPTTDPCGPITNVATVSATGDTNTANNTAQAVTQCTVPPPDVAITKLDNPDPVSQGAPLTYTLTVQNVSAVTATNVAVTDPLPSGTGFVSCTASQGTCVNNAGTVTANLGTLVAGASATISLVVTAPTTNPCGPIVNVATVAATGDTNTANNQATATTQCNQPAAFLIIDVDSIDNQTSWFLSNGQEYFPSAMDVNDDIRARGQRAELTYFNANVGSVITLRTGQVGDEGWFAPNHIPASWVSAGPTGDGLRNYVGTPVGTGLGGGGDDSLLDKTPDVRPLRHDGMVALSGRTVCAVVYDSDIPINYDAPPLGVNGNLMGENLGTVAFKVLAVTPVAGQPGYSASTLPLVTIEIVDATTACAGAVAVFSGAPIPTSSSTPFDVN